MNHVLSRVPAHRLTGRSGLDPRTKLLTITVCNMLAMGAFPSKVLWIIVALATLLLLIDARGTWRSTPSLRCNSRATVKVCTHPSCRVG